MSRPKKLRKENIFTIPNIITVFRLLLIPFFISCLVRGKTEIAVLLFAAIALSDALDGLSARMMKQKTRIGALFDSITDWLVIIGALVTFLFIKRYLSANIIAILMMPIIVILIAKGIYVKKKKKTSPTIIGKITTAFAYITTVALLINFAYKDIFLIGIIVLAYATMVVYIVKDVKLFIE